MSDAPEKLTPEQVRHVARLARLTLTDDEVEHFAHQLSDVIGYVSKLAELDVAEVAPMAHPIDVTNVLRDDEPAEPMSVDDVLANSPDSDRPFFKVVKVLGDGGGA